MLLLLLLLRTLFTSVVFDSDNTSGRDLLDSFVKVCAEIEHYSGNQVYLVDIVFRNCTLELFH